MINDDTVRARINSRIKEDANLVLATMGLDASSAFRMMMTRIAVEKRLPFDPLVPNAETIAAMEAARRGDTVSFESMDALLSDLDADD